MNHEPDSYVEVDGNGIGWNVTVSYAGHTHVYDKTDITRKVQIPPVISNYSCRCCNHGQFEAVYNNPDALSLRLGTDTIIGPGNQSPFETKTKEIVSYQCPNCSVTFGDPTKFSANQPPEIIPPVATSKPNRFGSIMLSDDAIKDLDEFGLQRQTNLD